MILCVISASGMADGAPMSDQDKLAAVRKRIDAMDDKLIELISQRAEQVLQAATMWTTTA